MSNWTGAARSNYVRFKDLEALKAAIQPFGGISVEPKHGDGKDPGLVCLLASNDDDGGWPSWCCVEWTDEAGEEHEEEREFSFLDDVVPHLAEGEVLVVMQSGHEKLRYVDGYASAFTWDGRACHLCLDDIYDLAASTFGIERKAITDALY